MSFEEQWAPTCLASETAAALALGRGDSESLHIHLPTWASPRSCRAVRTPCDLTC